MIKQKHTTGLVLAVCLLGLPVLAGQGDPVTRPHMVSGNATMVMNPQTGAWQMTDWGQATHVGLWTDTASGWMDNTGSQHGQGTIVAADGDTIDWVMSGNTVTYTGGTGRFECARGEATLTITSQQPPTPNPDGTITLEFTYTMSGEITY